MLVGAGVGFEAVLPRGGGGLAVAEDVLHGGDVLFYLVVLFLQGGGEFLLDEAAVGVGIDDAEGVYLAAMRDDVVLQGGVAAVGLAEGGAGLDLVDVEAAVVALAYDVGEHQHVVVLEAGLEEDSLCGRARPQIEELGGARGVEVDVALQLGAEVDAVGKAGLEGVFEVAAAVEAAHLLGGVAGQARVEDIEPQRAVALQAPDVFALAQ